MLKGTSENTLIANDKCQIKIEECIEDKLERQITSPLVPPKLILSSENDSIVINESELELEHNYQEEKKDDQQLLAVTYRKKEILKQVTNVTRSDN